MRACGRPRLLKVATNQWCHATFLTLALAGCQAPRPPEPAAPPSAPTVSAPVTPPPAVDTDRIASVAQAEGRTLVTLPPRGDLQPGDTLHILTGDRVIASALVIESGPEGVRATVVALSDLRRPVHPGDRVGTIPADTPSAAHAAPAAATTPESAGGAIAPTAPAIGSQVEASATVAMTPDHAPHTPAPDHAHEAATGEAHPHDHTAATHTTTTAPTTATKPPAPAVDLTPEIRARLEAERAYWELSARILRLPSGGPELTALQQRLRNELAEMAP